jgi:hypothetical protein
VRDVEEKMASDPEAETGFGTGRRKQRRPLD